MGDQVPGEEKNPVLAQGIPGDPTAHHTPPPGSLSLLLPSKDPRAGGEGGGAGEGQPAPQRSRVEGDRSPRALSVHAYFISRQMVVPPQGLRALH